MAVIVNPASVFVKRALRKVTRGRISAASSHLRARFQKDVDSDCFAIQSIPMQTDWAAENLKVIRTLMERNAVYRRALAPLMGAVGLTGLAASVVGALLQGRTPRAFAAFWLVVALICIAEAFCLIRRQALKESES